MAAIAGRNTVRHPLFARAFHRVSGVMEREVGRHRDALLAGLSGEVVEVGAGNGMNFGHYPTSVLRVVAVEPDPYLRARAEDAAHRADVPVTVLDALADELPLADASVDAAVCSLVLCSVPDQRRALAELRRVVRPGGELRVFEHVRSATARKARVQAAVDRSGVWARLAGGCHCARDTLAAIADAGFRPAGMRHVDVGPAWLPANPYVLGRAVAAP
ncbi:MAG TPA: class I SAM-dependent methyltransferase [Solirubrobacteraceae bacterium]|nr:class I SAM-dependent methyltransferase [Solirubrobacteraceae bacterium]